MKNIIIPDTSVLIEGILSKKINELKPKTIIIHEAALAELEAQANRGREIGLQGLDEIKKLREHKPKVEVQFKGSRPGEFEIKHAKAGEIDSLIRELAGQEKGTLLTADKVQAMVAESKGIDVILIEFEEETKPLALASYFDKNTMSVHLSEGCIPKAKKGRPGAWTFDEIDNTLLEREQMQEMAKDIIKEAKSREDGFVELDRRGSTVVQISNYRVVITRPPFSDGYEITAVRPVRKLSFKEYQLSEKLKTRIDEQAEGILIAGAPGHGKTTFATALAHFYLDKNKIVKTVEAPRDLELPPDIRQLSMSHGTSQEIHDVLLLSRPDYTIFDEMRNTEDFRLFADMRLSGVGMIGVMHATLAIDAIQRFLGRIELGVIPHVVDTVIFIKNGLVEHVYSVHMEVKVPHGMTEDDLARPIVVVNDFESSRPVFEIYSYGDQTIVVPVTSEKDSGAKGLAAKAIEQEFKQYSPKAKARLLSGNRAAVYVPESVMSRIIGKQGKHIESIEKRLGISLDVKSLEEYDAGPVQHTGQSEAFEADVDKKSIKLYVDNEHANKDVQIFVDDDYLLTARVSKKGVIRLAKGNKIAKILLNALNSDESVELKIQSKT